MRSEKKREIPRHSCWFLNVSLSILLLLCHLTLSLSVQFHTFDGPRWQRGTHPHPPIAADPLLELEAMGGRHWLDGFWLCGVVSVCECQLARQGRKARECATVLRSSRSLSNQQQKRLYTFSPSSILRPWGHISPVTSVLSNCWKTKEAMGWVTGRRKWCKCDTTSSVASRSCATDIAQIEIIATNNWDWHWPKSSSEITVLQCISES